MTTQTPVSGSTAPAAPATTLSTYTINPSHSSAQSSVRHIMISNVKGEFSVVSGTFVYAANNLAASRIDAVIDVNSIHTREPHRDAHLKSPDFFDAAQFPTLTIRSKEVRNADGDLQVKGNLPVGASATTTLNHQRGSHGMAARRVGCVPVGGKARRNVKPGLPIGNDEENGRCRDGTDHPSHSVRQQLLGDREQVSDRALKLRCGSVCGCSAPR